MNYTINETFEMSGYTAVIEADQNLASLITDDFRMEVRDILTNQVEEITKEDLMKWGTSVDTDVDPSLWETQSCINNGGMYINFNGNTLTFKQIIPCLSGDIPMGYNSSEVNINFNNEDNINFYSKTLPFFKREFPKSDNYDVEPILSAGSARPDYDFDDFRNNILMSGCKSNFEYNTVGDLYVNNNMGHIKKYNKSLTEYTKDYENKQTPKFYSDISAFYITTNQLGGITPYDLIDEYKGTHWNSTIWNETTDEETDILAYPRETAKSATIEFNGLTSDVIYNVYRQIIDDTKFQLDYRKNVLKFYIDFENHGIHVATEPKPLYIDIERQDGQKKIHVKIVNPNLWDGEEPHPLKDAKIFYSQTETYGIDGPDNPKQVDNILEFDIYGDIECGYSFIQNAWLELAYPGYSSDFVKQKTYVSKGPNDYDAASKKIYKEITCEVLGYKKYTDEDNPPSTIQEFNIAEPAMDDVTHTLLLKDNEYGIIAFKITNPNAGSEWISSNKVTVEAVPLNGAPHVDPADRISIDTNETIFFVNHITCNEEEPNNIISVYVGIDSESTCKGEWAFKSNDQFDSEWFYLNEEEPLLPIAFLTCDDTGDTNPCYEYTGLKSNPMHEKESKDHILDVYSKQDGTIITEKTEYGIQRFKIVNPNNKTKSPSDRLTLTIYKDNISDTITTTFANFDSIAGTLPNTGLTIYNQSASIGDTSTNAVAYFEVYGITPSKIKATAQILSDSDPNPTSLNTKTTKSITWSEKSFIPKEWEEYNNYVIFTKSKLHLDGARIGVRSIYCTAIQIDNASTVDTSYSDDPNFPAGIYVDCSEQWSDGSYIILNNANVADQGLQGSVKYANLNPPIDLKDNGENNVWYNAASKNVIYLTKDIDKTQYVTAVNNNYVGSKMEVKSMEVPDLPRFNITYDGTDNISINDRQSITLNAGGNIQSYNQFNAGNDCTLTLGAGEYYFKSFTAGTGLQIVIPQLNAGEYVRICVQGKVEVSNGVNLQNNNADYTTFMLYSDYASSNDTDYAIKFASYHGTQQNYGVIVAPDGGVRFENGILWTGAIWSKGLSMANGCSLQSVV